MRRRKPGRGTAEPRRRDLLKERAGVPDRGGFSPFRLGRQQIERRKGVIRSRFDSSGISTHRKFIALRSGVRVGVSLDRWVLSHRSFVASSPDGEEPGVLDATGGGTRGGFIAGCLADIAGNFIVEGLEGPNQRPACGPWSCR